MKASPLRMLLVGAGFMGRTHLASARRLRSVQYVGVLSRTRSRAMSLGREFRLPVFTGLESAVDATNPDAVDLCLPTRRHGALAAEAGSLGLHVLCEKPLALTVDKARHMAQEADRRGVRLMVAHVLRFWPEYAYAVTAIRAGRFGRVRSVDCRRLSPPPSWNTWMRRESVSGGAVLDLQIHDMDFVLQILGAPDRVCAVGARQAGGINSVFSRLRYSTDTTGHVQASFAMPPSYPFRMYFSIACDEAVLEMDSWREHSRQLRVFPARGRPFSPRLPPVDAYGAQIDYFARQIRSGLPFERVPTGEAIAALAMCEASRESCRSGTPVSVGTP